MQDTILIRTSTLYKKERKRIQEELFKILGILPKLKDVDKFIILKSRLHKIPQKELPRILKNIDKILLG